MVIDCGDLAASSVSCTLALFEPLATGLNFTDSVHVALTARVAPQVVVSAKSSAEPPVRLIDLKVTLRVPLLVTSIALAAEVLPTFSFPKAIEVALSVKAEAAVTLTSTAVEVEAP